MACATSSLPVPDSPVIRTVLLVRHTVSTSRNTSSIGGLRPMMPAKPCSRRGLAQHDVLVAQAPRLEQLPHLHRHQVDVAERLLEQRFGAQLARAAVHSSESRVQCAVIISHDRRRAPSSRTTCSSCDAVEARHADVGEHDVDVLAARRSRARRGRPRRSAPRSRRAGTGCASTRASTARRRRSGCAASAIPAAERSRRRGWRLLHDACRSACASARSGKLTRNIVPPPRRGCTSMRPP